MAASSDRKPSLTTANMSTKELARSLGLIQKLSSSTKKSDIKVKKQPFTYLVVIDFESTCWKDKRMSYAPEIIEFPAVLIHTSTGVIESEFHYYVQPSEHPRLSDFCRELTGITQSQVDNGIPIGTCLMLFNNWLREVSNKKNIKFLSDVLKPMEPELTSKMDVKWCTFVTWSDWDIGICLKNECQRKRHLVPQPLRSWIDLRATYKTFYSRKPNGLAGALKDLGIEFLGRQHFGLDDARNTARLAWRMIKDGCVMNISSSIDASVSVLHKIIQNGFKINKPPKETQKNVPQFFEEAQNTTKKRPDNQPNKTNCIKGTDSISVRTALAGNTPQERNESHSCAALETIFSEQESKVTSFLVSRGKEQMTKVPSTLVQSLVTPRVSVSGFTSNVDAFPAKTGDTKALTLVAPVTYLTGLASSTRQQCSSSKTKPVSGSDASFMKRKLPYVDYPILTKRGLVKQTLGTKLSSTKSLSSFRDENSIIKTSTSSIQSGAAVNILPSNPESKEYSYVGVEKPCKASNISEFIPTPRLVDKTNLLSSHPVDVLTNSRAVEAVPRSNVTPKCVGAEKSFGVSLQNADKNVANLDKENSVFKTPKAISSLNRESLSVKHAGNHSNVTQYSNWKGAVTPKNSKSPSCVTPNSIGGSVTPVLRFNGGSVTPPLCDCGRRARRLTVAKAGPNQGRVFYACSVRNNRSSFGKSPGKFAKGKKSCKFFCWEPKGIRSCSPTQRTLQGTNVSGNYNIVLSFIDKP